MMTLAEAIRLLASRCTARAVGEARFEAVGTDSRAIVPGQLFVALRGERFDGHDFVETALAAGWRERFDIALIGITGSNGKTTVKEMCASILRAWFGGEDAVLATQGNLNNDIGLPLTLLGLRAHHKAAVIEMGMNRPGEIAVLSGWARPTVALVNNAQRAHLEGMGSLDAVAQEKGCIYGGLVNGGVAVVNADDEYADKWREENLRAGRETVGFSLLFSQFRVFFSQKSLILLTQSLRLLLLRSQILLLRCQFTHAAVELCA